MSVSIKEINIRDLGPIQQFSMKPGLFNLICGHNEMGKTYLVEFLIRSLFKNIKQWSLRSETGQGKISVQGLEGKDVIFSPKSDRKLDDYWSDSKLGLPPDFSRLLMVKGAEVALNESGADKNVVLKYLSGQDVLSRIEEKIRDNIRKAEIHSEDISGPAQGYIKNRTEINKQLVILDQLFEDINSDYSGGQRKILIEQKEILGKKLVELEKAKKYRAFQLSREIDQLQKEIHRMDEGKLNQLDKDVHLYRQKEQELKRKKDLQQKAEKRSEHYTWLQQAEQSYDTLLKESGGHVPYLFLLLTICMVTASGILLFLKITPGVWIAIGIAVLCGGFAVWQVRRAIRNTHKESELQKIRAAYQERFGKPLSDHSAIKEKLRIMEEDFNIARLLKKQLEDDITDLDSKKVSIENRMACLVNQEKNGRLWEEQIFKQKNHLSDLNRDVEEKRIILGTLQVDVSDYVTEKPDIQYSKNRDTELRNELGQIENNIQEMETRLSTLKQRICDQTGDKIDTSFDELIFNLQKKRSEVEEEYKQVTAEIIGKKAVFEVIQSLRKDEDQKILESLQSKAILELLKAITGRYENLTLKDNRIVVSDAFNDFDFSELSTGAQEQVLLALRIGFASKLLGRQGVPLFLILDDAFQYSDWERRGNLVDTVIDLAKEGWQIIYLTMDDHIKQLFQKKGKVFGDRYQSVDLSEFNS